MDGRRGNGKVSSGFTLLPESRITGYNCLRGIGNGDESTFEREDCSSPAPSLAL
jgi:hypothetical protein